MKKANAETKNEKLVVLTDSEMSQRIAENHCRHDAELKIIQAEINTAESKSGKNSQKKINNKTDEIIGYILKTLNINPELSDAETRDSIERLDTGLSNLYEDAMSDNKQDNLNAIRGYNNI
jgi:hypothetical protein